MRIHFSIFLALLAGGGGLVAAPAPVPVAPAAPAPVALREIKDYQSARRALASNLYGVAFDKALAVSEKSLLSPEDAANLRLLMVEAAVRAGRVKDLPPTSRRDLPDSSAGKYWLAQAFALTGRLAEAEELLGEVAASKDKSLEAFAALARASILVVLREPDAALTALQPAAESQDKSLAFRARLRQAEIHLLLQQPEAARAAMATLPKPPSPRDTAAAQYLGARLAAATGDHQSAITGFEKVSASPRGLSVRIAHACLLGAAESRAALGQTDATTDALIAFVNQFPDSPQLPAAFHAMEKAGVFRDPSRRADVESWEKSQNPALAGLAVLHHVLETPVELAPEGIRRLDAFLAAHPKAPQLIDVTLRRIELLIADRKVEEAATSIAALDNISLNPEQEAVRAFLNGQLNRSTGNLAEAAKAFEAATTGVLPSDADAARYNAGLAAFLAGDEAGFETALAALLDNADDGASLGARLLLERGLYLSPRDPGTARFMLWRYLQAAPDAPDRARAYLVLAEIALRESPPAPAKALNQLEKIKGDSPPDILERRDYLLVWTADLSGDTSRSVEAANTFLARWPDSFLADEIRFKTGAALAADGQHAAARSYFEPLADKVNSPWREQAMFQAGRSAALSLTEASLDEATAIFQQVVDLKGPLAIPARQEQARLLFRQGKADDAIALIKETLAGKPAPEPEMRRNLISQMAEMMLEKRGNDSESATEAGKLFASLAGDPEASLAFRNRAAWFLGRAALAADNEEGALRTWFDAVDASFPPDAQPLESDWAFRCGMSAIELLGRQQNWPAAAAMAERLGRTAAPRAPEATALHERLKLEHFLWEQPETVSPANRN